MGSRTRGWEHLVHDLRSRRHPGGNGRLARCLRTSTRLVCQSLPTPRGQLEAQHKSASQATFDVAVVRSTGTMQPRLGWSLTEGWHLRKATNLAPECSGPQQEP